MAIKKKVNNASLGVLVTELHSCVDAVYSNALRMDAEKNIAQIQNMPWLSLSGADEWVL